MADILKLYKVATKAAYDSIKVKSVNNLYFVEKYDNGPALFKGEKRYTVSKEELDNILKSYSKSGHTHGWSEINNKPAQATRWPRWAEVTSKPSEMKPAAHKHDPADINVNSSNRFVTDTEKSKWNTASTNATKAVGWGDHSTKGYLTSHQSLTAYLKTADAETKYQPKGSYASASHSHAWSAITSKPSTFTPSTHTHAPADITQNATNRFTTDAEKTKWNTASTNATKAVGWGDHGTKGYLTSHQSLTAYLKTADADTKYQPKGSYASASHSHAWNTITGKPSTFAPSSHKHNPADINLNSSNRFVTDTEKSKWNTASTEIGKKVNKEELDNILKGYSKTGHVHDPAEFEESISYGVVFDGAEPKGIRVGNMDLHRKLPLQTQMRRCTLLDNGDVNYWLDPNNSLLKENGNSAILDGRDGQVMVFLPQFWYKVSNTSSGVEYRISERSLCGYTHSPACYMSAYEASLMRDKSILSSVVNNTANYRGGDNSEWMDGKQQSLLGKPVTNVSLTDFIKYASNRGANWYCNYYDAYKKMCFLYLVEYANRNSQAYFIANPTDEGFKQGGLGKGVTVLNFGDHDDSWNKFNKQNPFIPCGYTNSLGNNTGTKLFIMPYGSLAVYVPSYRGIENPFGHIGKWTDGIDVFVGEETIRLEINGKYVGDLAMDKGYIKTMLGEEIMPTEVGGGSTSYWCDQFFSGSNRGQRGVRFGGCAYDDSIAGLFCSSTHAGPSYADKNIGSRLCFFKRA